MREGESAVPEASVDVVRDFVYDSENKRYNEAYRNWRSGARGSFLYRYRDNSRVNSHSVGRMPAAENPAAAERIALHRSSERIGLALLICFCCEMIGGTLLVWLLGSFGFDIRLDFLSFSMRGSQWTTAAVRGLLNVIKYAIPVLLLIRLFRLPRRVFCPLRFGSVPELTAAVGFGMLTAGVYTLLDIRYGGQLSEQIFEYKTAYAVLAYGIFEVTAVSVLSELLMRGCILQVLRQFGDPFAVISTALIGFLMPNHTLSSRLGELLLGLAAGYLMLRGGSLPKCVLLRSVYITLSYARLVLVYAGMMPLWSFVLTLISAGAVAAASFAIRRSGRLRMHNLRTVNSGGEKFLQLIGSVTALPWTAAALLLALFWMFY